MKKIVFSIVCAALLLSICSCHSGENKKLTEKQIADTVSYLIKELSDSTKNKLPDFDDLDKKTLSKLAWELVDIYSSLEDSSALLLGNKIKDHNNTSDFNEALSSELIARYYFNNWQLDSAQLFLAKSKLAYQLIGDTAGLARVMFVKGLCNEQKEQFDEAFLDLNKSIEYLKHLNDTNSVADASVEIAFVFIRIGEVEKGKNILFKLKDFGERNPEFNGMLGVYKLLSEIYYHERDYERSKYHAFRALELANESASVDELSFIYNQIGISYMADEKYEKAIEFLNKTWEAKKNVDKNDAAVSLFNLGKCYYLYGKKDTAISILNQSLELSEGHPYMLKNKWLVYQLLCEINKSLNRYDLALTALEKSHIFKDSIDKIQNKELILKEQLKIEENEKNNQIALLSQEKEFTRAINRILLMLGLLALFLAVFMLLQTRKIYRKKNEIAQTRLKHTINELETNKRILKEFQERLIERNYQVINQLPNEESEEPDTDQVTPFAEINESIPGIANLRLLTQDDWTRFTTLLDEVYPGLRQRVHTKFKDLTPAEERIFLLICIKTENKEIAAILGISPASVRKAKYRLKQKIHVPADTGLEEFIYSAIS
jgi:tetratricopeptide (TPR) repeat protein/DNA-binding CsgD family transcriptional regulator